MNATYAQLCRYHYDPLDRLATCSPAEQQGIQRFYQKNRLTTEIQGQIQRAFFQTEDQLLAQHQGPNSCTLLASDQQRSVLDGINAAQRQSASYTPYGVRHPQANPLELLGYTGERADPVTGHYLLGNGYRAYNPVLMRFNSPDSLSPFGEGGLNAYAYCVGDPVNSADPTGHTPAVLKAALQSLGLMKKIAPPATIKSGNLNAAKTTLQMNNIKELGQDLFSFEHTTHEKSVFSIFAHGNSKPINGTHYLKSGKWSLPPDYVHKAVIDSGTDLQRHDEINIIACFSGRGNNTSFAAIFSEITAKPVTGYIGDIHTRPQPENFTGFISRKSSLIRRNSNGTYSHDEGLEIFMTNPYAPNTKNHSSFDYKKVTHEMTRL